jgi:hypothetical protein
LDRSEISSLLYDTGDYDHSGAVCVLQFAEDLA